MKKTILLMLLAVMTVGLSAQTNKEMPAFELVPTGSFIAPDGKDYVVYPVDGKSAHELFQMLCTNVGKVYRSPKDVMSVVDDKSVAIRAYSDRLMTYKMFGMNDYYGGYYHLLFEFKNGRIKISAPSIESISYNYKDAPYYKIVKSYFDEAGHVKEKHKEKKMYVEMQLNLIINSLIGYAAGKGEKNDNDW